MRCTAETENAVHLLVAMSAVCSAERRARLRQPVQESGDNEDWSGQLCRYVISLSRGHDTYSQERGAGGIFQLDQQVMMSSVLAVR